MSWRAGRVAALVVVTACAAAAPVFVSSPALAQPKDQDTHAKELFAKGDTAYAEGRYEEALAAFQEAYDLSKRPQLLFNVSNALERLGRLQEAVAALEKYLGSGKAKDREVVQKRLANLRKRVDEQKKEQDRIAKEEEEKEKARKEKEEADRRKAELAPPEVREVPLFQSQAPERPSKALPIALLVTGGVVLVAGGVFGAMTLSARGEAADGCKEGAAGNLCSSDAKSALDREKTFGLITDISLLSGLVITGIGFYLFLAGPSGPEVRAKAAKAGSVRVTGGPGLAGVGVVGSF
jgi:tetratricopeptide (TPR) repeat protein